MNTGRSAFMTTELESLLNTRTRYSESSSDSTRPTSTPVPASGWQFVRSWSRDMVGEFRLSPEEKGKDPLSASRSPQRSEASHASSRRVNIVLVEDNPTDILMVKEA